MPDTASEITIRERTDENAEGARIFVLRSSFGMIDATFIQPPGWYNIAGIDVFRRADRGKGHGQELLRASLEHARELGASAVVAAIISRECLEAMRRVFEQDAITVQIEGDYAPDGRDNNPDSPTSAALWLDLD